jgi:hypothetical protein
VIAAVMMVMVPGMMMHDVSYVVRYILIMQRMIAFKTYL